MNNRRLLPLLLALIMLFSVLQPAGAATNDPPYATQETWSSWTIVTPATCTRDGLRTRYSNMGNVQREVIPKGHNYGPLTIIEEATCQTRARAQRVCSRCGHTEWTYVGELGDHRWGEWKDLELVPGEPIRRQQRTCEVCGETEDREFPMQVEPAQSLDGIAPELALSYSGAPAGILKAGTTVEYTMTAYNAGNVNLTVIAINPGPSGRCATDSSAGWAGNFLTEMEPGETRTFLYRVVINGTDVSEHDVLRTLQLAYRYEDADGQDKIGVSNTSTISFPIPEQQYALSLTYTGGPDGPLTLGSVIDLTLTVHNNSNAEAIVGGINTNVTADHYVGWAAAFLTPMEAGSDRSTEYHIIVNANDVTNGSVHRVISFAYTYTDESGAEQGGVTNSIVLDYPVANEPIPDPNAGKLTLSVIIPGGSQEPYAEDDKIIFHATAMNSGEVTLVDVILHDAYGLPNGHVDIGPGKEYSLDFEYTVTEEDAALGTISLEFDAVGWTEGDMAEVWSNSVPFDLTAEAGETEHDPHMTLIVSGGPVGDVGLGTIIPLTMAASNDGQEPLRVMNFYNEPFSRSHLDNNTGWAGFAPGEIAPGEAPSFPYSIVVSQEDIDFGSVHREFSLLYSWTDEEENTRQFMSNVVPVDIPLTDGELHTELTLTCVPNGPGSVWIGDEVSGTFTLTNTGKVPVEFTNALLMEYTGCSTNPMASDDMSEWLSCIGTVLEPGDSFSVAQRTTVLAEDVAAGEVLRRVFCTGVTVGNANESEKLNSNPAVLFISLIPSEEEADPVTITKVRVDAPANGIGYVVDETIHYQITVTNESDYDVHSLVAEDPIIQTPIIGTCDTLPAHGAPWVVNVDYTVTQQDIDDFEPTLYNQAHVKYIYDLDGEEYISYSNTESAPLYRESIGTLSLIKRCMSTPTNGLYYVPGEVIHYELELRNDSDTTYTHVTVTDPLAWNDENGDVIGDYDNVVPGFHDKFEYGYTVTDADADAGQVVNQAHFVALVRQSKSAGDSNIVTCPTGFPDLVVDVGVLKFETSTPANGSYYVLGEWIEYSLEVKNNSNITLSTVILSDTLKKEDSGVLTTVYDLGPDDGFGWTFKHQVTQPDVDNTEVYNYGIVDFEFGEGFSGHIVSQPVVSPTGEGTPKHHTGDGLDSCVRTLAASGPDRKEYELAFCGVHGLTAEAAQTLLDAAVTEEQQQTARQQALMLWRSALTEMNGELADALPSSAGAAVLGSRNAFDSYLAAYEAMLRANGKPEADISDALISLISARCVDLCYALHHAPDPHRPDSVLTGNYEELLTAAADTHCAAALSAVRNGKARLTETLCANHAGIEKTVSLRLTEAKTPEALAGVFEYAEFSYRSALNSQVSLRGVVSGQAAQRTKLACQSAAAALLDREYELYTALYPEHPEIAAEIAAAEARSLALRMCEK